MTNGVFEPQILGFLSGSLTMEILDDKGYPPPNIIRTGDSWKVHFVWSMSGTAADNIHTLGGKWRIQVYAESIGPSVEKVLLNESLGIHDNEPVVTPLTYSYDKTFQIPKAIVPPGLFKLGAVITADNDNQPTPPLKPYAMAAFCEGPVVQFFDSP